MDGYLGGVRQANKNLIFGVFADPHMRSIVQIVAQREQDEKNDKRGTSSTSDKRLATKKGLSSKEPSESSEPSTSKSTPVFSMGKLNGQEDGPGTSQGSNSKSGEIKGDLLETDQSNVKGLYNAGPRPALKTENRTTSQDGDIPDMSSSSSSLGLASSGFDGSSIPPSRGTTRISIDGFSKGTSEPDPSVADHLHPDDKGHCFQIDMSPSQIARVLQISSPHTPVTIWGNIQRRRSQVLTQSKINQHFGTVHSLEAIEIILHGLVFYNANIKNHKLREDVKFPPEQRHLQIRTSSDLRDALRLRSRASSLIRQSLFKAGFDEIETPLLFKSSREGAREFIVPTREHGMMYALPQSPQQYKQILIASGIARYFQFAKCFRDEDLRADRQPEFTQVDLEMSFANRYDVITVMEDVIRRLWHSMKAKISSQPYNFLASNKTDRPARPFDQLDYDDAMCSFGSDKPDRRLGSIIQQPDNIPADLVRKITTIRKPIIDMMKFRISEDPNISRKFITEFLDSSVGTPFRPNAVGAPGIFIFDISKPVQGLSAFGFEAADHVKSSLKCENGDLVIITARPRERLSGSSTIMGNMRLAMFDAAVKQGLRSAVDTDDFLYVIHFPMFEAITDAEPGQGGSAGIKARHHPFTAAARGKEVLRKLAEDPLSVRADSWDLVINGVEVGGGSVRIHKAEMQEFVFREALKMSPTDIEAFRPLLNALAANCPPHAGMAIGFDRLLAVLLRKQSIRDVIAFPKYGMGGFDRMMGSPAPITEEQLETYDLQLRGTGIETFKGIRFHK